LNKNPNFYFSISNFFPELLPRSFFFLVENIYVLIGVSPGGGTSKGIGGEGGRVEGVGGLGGGPWLGIGGGIGEGGGRE
jgi:hypothetical protein